MRSAHQGSGMRRVIHSNPLAAAAMTVLLSSASLFADLVVQTDGAIRAGRIVSDQPDRIVLLAAGSSGPRRKTIERKDIQAILGGPAELERIGSCDRPADLLQWANDYWHTGFELLALRCIRAEIRLAGAVPPQPVQGATPLVAGLRDRMALRIWASTLNPVDATGLLRLADWAEAASLPVESRQFVRRAWRTGQARTQVLQAAQRRGLTLESPLRVDLTPSLLRPLIEPSVPDEGEFVSPPSDHVFVTLPFRYSQSAAGLALSRGGLRGKDARSLIGLRTLRVRDGAPILEPVPQEPIYEKLDFRLDPEGAFLVALRNTTPPALPPGTPGKAPRPSGREKVVVPTGWAALVFAVPKSTNQLSFEWPNQQEEVIDLSFLGQGFDPGFEADVGNPESPGLRRLVGLVESGMSAAHTASAVLALARLARLRPQLNAAQNPVALERVETAVLRAGGHDGPEVAEAAWRYFIEGEAVLPATAAALAASPVDLRLRWIALIDHLALRTSRQDCERAAALLGPLLRSADPQVCDAVWDVWLTLEPGATRHLPANISDAARVLLLARLDLVKSEAHAGALVRALLGTLRPGDGALLAEQIGRFQISLGPADAPILEQFHDLSDSASRADFLTVLRAMDLRDAVYTRPFRDMMDEAAGPRSDPSVAEAAFRLAIQLARRSLDGACGDPFPLACPRRIDDPAIAAVARAAVAGSAATRLQAMELLLAFGFVEEAARGLDAEGIDESMRVELLRVLAPGEQQSFALPTRTALLGFVVRPDWPATAQAALDLLTRRAAVQSPSLVWQGRAALRTGIDIRELARAARASPSPASGHSLRWLSSLTRLSQQERARFADQADEPAAALELQRADQRRSRLVDGDYGVLAVVETTAALRDLAAPSESEVSTDEPRPLLGPAWAAPCRTTVLLPALRLELAEDREEFTVHLGDEVIGAGRPLDQPRALAGPLARRPILETASEPGFVGDRPEPRDHTLPNDAETISIGPLALPALASQPSPTGVMELRLGPLLQSAASSFRGAAAPALAQLTSAAPNERVMHLGYVQFGAFCGWLDRRPLPSAARRGDVHLLNVMIVIEPMDR